MCVGVREKGLVTIQSSITFVFWGTSSNSWDTICAYEVCVCVCVRVCVHVCVYVCVRACDMIQSLRRKPSTLHWNNHH